MNKQSKFLTLDEVLKQINDDITLINPDKVFHYSPNSALDVVFDYAFNPDNRWLLPEGVPPYKPANVQSGNSLCDLLISIRRGRLSYFAMPELHPNKRQQLFIEMLEVLSKGEADVMVAVKDQTLTKLFPNITAEALKAAGYLSKVKLPEKPVVEKKEVAKKPASPKSKAPSKTKAKKPVAKADKSPKVV